MYFVQNTGAIPSKIRFKTTICKINYLLNLESNIIPVLSMTFSLEHSDFDHVSRLLTILLLFTVLLKEGLCLLHYDIINILIFVLKNNTEDRHTFLSS
jgi:hypothetical protein